VKANDIVLNELKHTKMTYKEMEEKTGINRSSLWHYIRGKRAWSADAWLTVMSVLGTSKHYGDKTVIVCKEGKAS